MKDYPLFLNDGRHFRLYCRKIAIQFYFNKKTPIFYGSKVRIHLA